MLALVALVSCFVPLSSARADVAKIDTKQTGTVTADCTITMPEALAGKEIALTGCVAVSSYADADSILIVPVSIVEVGG